MKEACHSHGGRIESRWRSELRIIVTPFVSAIPQRLRYVKDLVLESWDLLVELLNVIEEQGHTHHVRPRDFTIETIEGNRRHDKERDGQGSGYDARSRCRHGVSVPVVRRKRGRSTTFTCYLPFFHTSTLDLFHSNELCFRVVPATSLHLSPFGRHCQKFPLSVFFS